MLESHSNYWQGTQWRRLKCKWETGEEATAEAEMRGDGDLALYGRVEKHRSKQVYNII